MSKRTICIITSARSEYSASKWLMKEIQNDSTLELQVVVTGAHLQKRFGNTVLELERDNIPIDYKINTNCHDDSLVNIAISMGECLKEIPKALSALKPDIVVIFGDRYELLPICSAALILRIPIAHVSGGDITEGAIDDSIRHAITKLSHLHFPGTEYSANILRQLGESSDRIFVVGEPGLENFTHLNCISKEELAAKFNMDINKRWILFTYHPETLSKEINDIKVLNDIFTVLDDLKNTQVMMTYPNADPGHNKIIEFLIKANTSNPSKYKLVKNLGQKHFISFMKKAWCMVGNSSSSVFEAPTAKLPSILIGGRQKGRLLPGNIITSTGRVNSLHQAFNKVEDVSFQDTLKNIVNPYGNGDTAIKIVSVLKNINLERLLYKQFIKI